jgi:hypothetical protein
MVDNAEARDFERIPLDWRARPDRDEEWKAKQIAKMGEDAFSQEHEAKRLHSGEAAFDMRIIERRAAEVEWVGNVSSPVHRYAKGVDQSSLNIDKTFCCVLDLTLRPCQVVALVEFKPSSKSDKSRDEQKIEFMQDMDKQYAGPMYIDGTNEKGIVGLAKIAKKHPVHISTSQALQSSKITDDVDNQVWQRVPRHILLNNGTTCLHTGRLVCHLHEFVDLFEAFKSARKGVDKRMGRNVDQLDAFILACLALYRKEPKQGRRSAVEVKGSEKGLLGKKW